jgi:hypothetical protein
MKTLRIFALLCFILGFNSRVNAQTFQFKFDIPMTIEVPCLSDVLTGTITYHGTFSLVNEETVKRYQDQFHGELTGLTGEVYRFVQIVNQQNKVEVSNGSYIENTTILWNLVGRGGMKYSAHMLWHLTVKPDGEVIIANWKAKIECD